MWQIYTTSASAQGQTHASPRLQARQSIAQSMTNAAAPVPTLHAPYPSTTVLTPALSSQAVQLRSVFERAMVDRQQLASPASSANMTELSTVFTEGELQREQATATVAAAVQKNSEIRALGGGADSFSYSRIATLSDSQAVLTGSYRAWARVGQVQKNGQVLSATPSNIIDYTAQLSRDAAGNWRVSSLVWSFAPGSEP